MTYLVRPHVRAYPHSPPEFIWDLDGFVAVEGSCRGEAVASFIRGDGTGAVQRYAAMDAARFEVVSAGGPFRANGVPVLLHVMRARFKNNNACDACGRGFVDAVPPVDVLCPTCRTH